jgi:tetratricopeptide (TPR) repeat protein
MAFCLFGLFLVGGAPYCHAQFRSGRGGGAPADPKVVDSFQLERNRVRDSMAAVRKYRAGKHYRDSVAKAHKVKLKELAEGRQQKADSIKNKRGEALGAVTAARQARTDSIKQRQQHRADSLAAIKKYKGSRRYADSVALARRMKSDSIKTAQTHFRDSLASSRKHKLDSATAMRKKVMDSVKVARTKHMDSLKIARKVKTDSLAKVKAEKEKLAKAAEKKRQEQQKLKLEIKFKQKREAWSNTSMLKKRWSPLRRFFQNSFTHYNYYFNANKKMQEAMANMLRSRKENYDSLINLYPFDPNKDSTLLAADMDSIMRKASVGLQIHDPREKWANNLYLLLGQANYYRGRYSNAATTFKYIIAKDEEAKRKEYAQSSHYGEKTKEEPSILEEEHNGMFSFLQHKSVHNESALWLARTYTSWHMVENAQSVVSLLESDHHLPQDLKGRVAAEKAFAYLADNNDEAAVPQLNAVADDKTLPDWLRMRAAFLSGQLCQNRGKYDDAVAGFETALTFYPKIEMDFYARKNIAYNSLLAGKDAATAMRPLKKVLNDAKYSSYYDQVYYVLGRLAIKAGKTDDAITYLNKSIHTPKATKKQKALSFAAMGDAYYTDAKYQNAKVAYDSASKYAVGIKDTTGLSTIQRAKLLNEIVGPANIIHAEDSLLELATGSKREQLAAVRRSLKALQQSIDDSIANAENAGIATIAAQDQGNEGSDYSNWYFSNPSQMQQGSSDFKKKWGERPLVDNWRRSAAISGSSNSKSDELKETADDFEQTKNGLPSEESLLAMIPNTPEKRLEAEHIEQKAYIDLAKAYFHPFDDMTQCLSTLDGLDKKFPDHNQKEEELYLRYRVAVKQGNWTDAQTYADQLLAKFPKSEYAKLLKPKAADKSEAKNGGIAVATYYDETYNMLLHRQYSEALMRIDIGKKQYDNPYFKKRFLVAEAMALAGMGNLDKADTALNAFLKTYPATDTLSDWAKSIKAYVASVRKTGLPAWYKDTPASQNQSAAKSTDSSSAKKDGKSTDSTLTAKPEPAPKIPAMYGNNKAEQHYCIVILPGLDSRVTQLKNNLKAFDSSNSPGVAHTVILDYFAIDQTVMVVKAFRNADSAAAYLGAITSSTVFGSFDKSQYTPLIISASNYLKLYADKKTDSYIGFYNAVYK